MSTKQKLINNNQKLNSTNKNLLAIKNAFLKPLSDVPIPTQEKYENILSLFWKQKI